jgi:prevent-host-death family protein
MSKLRTVTMLDLRQRAEKIVEQVRRGESLVLTYRGRPAVRLEPIRPANAVTDDDPFYRLPTLADRRQGGLSNREIDEIVYGA